MIIMCIAWIVAHILSLFHFIYEYKKRDKKFWIGINVIGLILWSINLYMYKWL